MSNILDYFLPGEKCDSVKPQHIKSMRAAFVETLVSGILTVAVALAIWRNGQLGVVGYEIIFPAFMLPLLIFVWRVVGGSICADVELYAYCSLFTIWLGVALFYCLVIHWYSCVPVIAALLLINVYCAVTTLMIEYAPDQRYQLIAPLWLPFAQIVVVFVLSTIFV